MPFSEHPFDWVKTEMDEGHHEFFAMGEAVSKKPDNLSV